MEEILGVKIDNLSQKEALSKIGLFLDEPRFHQIVTINPEFVLEAQKNAEFREILNNSDLGIADGFGLKLAFWAKGKHLVERFPGTDLFVEILKMADKKRLSVFFACREGGLSTFQEVKKVVENRFPGIEVKGCETDFPKCASLPFDIEADILFSSFGAPRQELFIDSRKNARIRLAIGVGGSFDFLTGKTKRAPKILRKIGLEWAWRLFQEPKYRLRRVARAVFVFPAKLIIDSLKSHGKI